MKYPEFLQKNGTIGYVAPSFGCAIEPYKSAFANALGKFKVMGYKADIGPNVYEESGIGISSTPRNCGEELNDSYCGNQNDVIISCGGGELMCEVVSYMDFERLKSAKPKWYMGYSDNTNFTFLLNTICDTASIYGPCASTFGMEPWHPSIQDAFDLLCGRLDTVSNYDKWEKEQLKTPEKPLEPYNVTEPFELKCFPDEDIEIEGRLIGGCVDCLVNLLGTRFDKVKDFNEKYKEDGIIWFLEACELNVMSIRRAFWQMKEAGWFEHVKGFIIGRPMLFGQDMFGLNQYQAVISVLDEYKVPVIMDVDIGHLSPMMPIVSGSTAKVTRTGNNISIKYTWR